MERRVAQRKHVEMPITIKVYLLNFRIDQINDSINNPLLRANAIYFYDLTLFQISAVQGQNLELEVSQSEESSAQES